MSAYEFLCNEEWCSLAGLGDGENLVPEMTLNQMCITCTGYMTANNAGQRSEMHVFLSAVIHRNLRQS